MNIVKPSVTLLDTADNMKLVEKVGRICYKSEDKITETSSKDFVKGLINRKHFAMLEHSNIIVHMTGSMYQYLREVKKLEDDGSKGDYAYDFSFLRCSLTPDGDGIISGSFRAWRDLFLNSNQDVCYLACALYYAYPVVFEDVVKSIYEEIPDEGDVMAKFYLYSIFSQNKFKEKYAGNTPLLKKHITHTLDFVCDRGISHEFVRHRKTGLGQESTRFCNYAKDKFGNSLTFIEPLYLDKYKDVNLSELTEEYKIWLEDCKLTEKHYLDLIALGKKPQEARAVLNTSIKTELGITCTEEEWEHIIDLRLVGSTGVPHPQMTEIMRLAYPLLVESSNNRLEVK